MKLRIENEMSRIAEQARGRFSELVGGAQKGARQAATRVSRGKQPVKALSRVGLKLTAVGHRTADKILKQNTKMVENQIDAFASRLQAAASASDVRDLVETQVRLIPQNASRLVNDAREALSIVAGAGSEVRDLLAEAVDGVRTGASTNRKTETKAVVRKAPASEAPARKVRARKPATAAARSKAA